MEFRARTNFLEADKTHGRKKQHGPAAENTRWGKKRKYMRRQILKILAGHMMKHQMLAAEGRHTSCGACIFSICLRMYFLLLPHIVFSAFDTIILILVPAGAVGPWGCGAVGLWGRGAGGGGAAGWGPRRGPRGPHGPHI